jgi:hypothetical protein
MRHFLKVARAAEFHANPSAATEASAAVFRPAFVALMLCPVCWVLWALLWRGGVSMRLLGLSLVLSNGHPASRLHCAWRALVVWVPVTALLWLTMWLDAYHPEEVRWSWASWRGALVILAGFALLALRCPARGLHDRLTGTYVVPR